MNDMDFYPSYPQRFRANRIARVIVVFLGLSAIVVSLRTSFQSQHIVMPAGQGKEGPSKTFVVASLEKEDISWLHQYLPEWDISRYVADDPSANLTVPKNKGQEAMTYLTWGFSALFTCILSADIVCLVT